MNRLHINPVYCKGCLICVEICPTRSLRASERINSRGYTLPAEQDMKSCKACGLCELMCPDFAIVIEETQEPRGKVSR